MKASSLKGLKVLWDDAAPWTTKLGCKFDV